MPLRVHCETERLIHAEACAATLRTGVEWPCGCVLTRAVAVCIRPSMRVLECRVGREGRIGQGVQKGNQLRLLDGAQLQSTCRVLHKGIHSSRGDPAGVVVFNDFLQGLETTVMHVGSGKCNVA